MTSCSLPSKSPAHGPFLREDPWLCLWPDSWIAYKMFLLQQQCEMPFVFCTWISLVPSCTCRLPREENGSSFLPNTQATWPLHLGRVPLPNPMKWVMLAPLFFENLRLAEAMSLRSKVTENHIPPTPKSQLFPDRQRAGAPYMA